VEDRLRYYSLPFSSTAFFLHTISTCCATFQHMPRARATACLCVVRAARHTRGVSEVKCGRGWLALRSANTHLLRPPAAVRIGSWSKAHHHLTSRAVSRNGKYGVSGGGPIYLSEQGPTDRYKTACQRSTAVAAYDRCRV
jgi:hypothetical protein